MGFFSPLKTLKDFGFFCILNFLDPENGLCSSMEKGKCKIILFGCWDDHEMNVWEQAKILCEQFPFAFLTLASLWDDAVWKKEAKETKLKEANTQAQAVCSFQRVCIVIVIWEGNQGRKNLGKKQKSIEHSSGFSIRHQTNATWKNWNFGSLDALIGHQVKVFLFSGTGRAYWPFAITKQNEKKIMHRKIQRKKTVLFLQV